MRFHFIIVILLTFSWLSSFALCKEDSQNVFCRLKTCVEGTHWDSDKIVDPVQIIGDDGIYNYNSILLPMGHVASAFLFHVFSEEGGVTYYFPKQTKLGVACDKTIPHAFIDLKGSCVGSSFFNYKCWFKSFSKLRVQPFRVNYWDGRKVHFLCTEFSNKENNDSKIVLEKKEVPINQMAAIAGPILKSRMKQLARAINADEKKIDPQKIISVVKGGKSVEDLGACRYFLDGNTLNLVEEALRKRFSKKDL